MLSGSTLNFTQTDIIKRQHNRRAARHLRPDLPSKTFAIGDIVFSNSDRSKLKARDKLIVREDIGDGQYRLDRLCGKSTYITSTVKPDFDLYAVEKAEETPPPELEKTVSWSNSDTVINSEDETPTPDRDSQTRATHPPKSGPITRSSRLQGQRQEPLRLQRQRREPLPKKRLLPPAPGKAAGYNPQPDHQAQSDPQPTVTFLVTPSYVPDIAIIAPPTAEDPPPTESDGSANPTSSDTDSDDTEGEGFLTPTESPQPTDDSEHNDPERSDRSESSEQETPSEDSPQSSPQAQAGPSSKPDPSPDAQPAAPYASIFGKGPKKIKRAIPIKRQRSTSYPPPTQQTPGDKTFVHPKQKKRLRSALKRIADHNSGPPAEDPDRHAQPPTNAEQDARPQPTSRSGRPLKKPTRL